MEYVFEFLLDLLLEGSIEVSKEKKIPKYIRYPLIIIIISLFFISVISFIFIIGLSSLNKNFFIGLFIILVSIFLLIMSVIKFRKIYLEKPNKQ